MLTARAPSRISAPNYHQHRSIPAPMHTSSRPRGFDDRGHLTSALNIAIEGFNLAKEVMNIAPAKAAFGSVSVILTMIRDSRLNEEECIKLGIACAEVCIALSRGMDGKRLENLNQSVSEAIVQLTTTVTEIQIAILKKRKRWRFLKLVHAKIDIQTLNTWRLDLSRVLDLFNAELTLNIHNAVTEMHNDLREMRDTPRETENDKFGSAQAPEPGELPPPPPRVCVGRDTLIEELVCRAEKLAPSALIAAGGTGKTAIALTVLHHERIIQKYSDRRRFIRCDEFPTSILSFLDRLSTVIGAGIKNATSLAPLRSAIVAQPTILVLDNAETILDPHVQDAQAIYAVVEELSQSPNLCLIITSRLSTIPPDCKRIDVPTLSKDAAQEIFYRIYPEGERSKLVERLLERLDFHPLSITILATIASQKLWDYHRILDEWEKQRVKVLQTSHRNQSLAASIEVSLDSPTFKELGPQAREVLKVVAFFPQGIDEKKLDWLFPDISDRENVVDAFCMLSLTSRYKGFVTMLAPLREYLRPTDLGSPSLLWQVKERYFSRLHLVDEELQPGMPGFEETKWILGENSNVEHLLETFVAIDEGSEDVWEAYADFLLHLSWHKPVKVVPEAESGDISGSLEKRKGFLGSFGKRMLHSVSDNLLGQKVINRFDKVLSSGVISGGESSRCLRVLCRMCIEQKTIPESMHIAITCDYPSSSPIYRGGYADVFRAEHGGHPVAIKSLRVYSTSNLEVIVIRFCLEVVLWRHLRHPNIIPLLGANFGDRQFSMVSEWMGYGNINEYTRRYEGANRIQLLAGAANGLEYMHSLHVVHGDLKGANILINNSFHACLTDFGLSTMVGVERHTADNASFITMDSEVSLAAIRGGTLRWMSPELLDPDRFGISDEQPVPTKRSDCYALGMVVYEVLCGNFPYADMSHPSAIAAILSGQRPQKPEAAESLGFTDELWIMVERCWRENWNERLEAKEIVDCLESAAKAWDTRPLPPADADSSDSEDRRLSSFSSPKALFS